MHKIIVNSVNKLKNLSFSNFLTEKSYKHVSNRCGIHTVSNSNAKRQPDIKNKAIGEAVVNFNEMVTSRREQAQRSILVQVNSEKSFTELQKYCSQYGTIIGAHHYALTNCQFILVEYSSQVEANQAIEHSTFDDAAGTCVRSPFLWFRAAPQNRSPSNDSKITGKLNVSGSRPIDYSEINEIMLGAESVSDQILILHRATTLNDLGIRLRFLAARQIEESINGIFPKAQACIFGSSVNGYGKLGCDLDLILQLNSMETKLDDTRRLVFHTKKSLTNSRSQVQQNLENLSDTLQKFLPGVCHVRRILQARVPIVRYHHEHLDLEVDLSMNNMSGVYMSELLYMFTQIDERVSPLVSSIRRWAQTNGITNTSPGVWISNFSLTCLVIFYLQQLDKPVLPTINSLIEQARPEDQRISEETELLCTFLRDLNHLKFTKSNTDTLGQLLIGFFEFYSAMSFSERAISLNDAKLHAKPVNSAVYIFNPLEPSLNVTKNMSFEECERFRTEVRNAAWMLESQEKSKDKSDTWGLVTLFRANQKPVIRPTMFFKSRMMEVTKLFNDSGINVKESDAMERNMKFKNNSVKNEVTNIQKKKRAELNAILKPKSSKR